MTLALMQPYFFPYLGYFSLMDAVDEFVFFDTVQYQPKSWMTRNRILNKERVEPAYLQPGLKKSKRDDGLHAVLMNKEVDWKRKIYSKLQHHNRAPFFRETISWLKETLQEEFTHLAELNCKTTKSTAEWLGISCHISSLKEKNLSYQTRPAKSEWGLWLAKTMGADAYVNSPGGAVFIGHQPFVNSSIRLGFLQPQLTPYRQDNDQFIPALSILDVLIWNGREKTSQLVKQYSIDWKN